MPEVSKRRKFALDCMRVEMRRARRYDSGWRLRSSAVSRLVSLDLTYLTFNFCACHLSVKVMLKTSLAEKLNEQFLC